MSFISVSVTGTDLVKAEQISTRPLENHFITLENRLEKIVPVNWSRNSNMPFELFEEKQEEKLEAIRSFGGYSYAEFQQIVHPIMTRNQLRSSERWMGAYSLTSHITNENHLQTIGGWKRVIETVDRYKGLVRLVVPNLCVSDVPCHEPERLYRFDSNVALLKIELFENNDNEDNLRTAITLAVKVAEFFEFKGRKVNKFAYLLDDNHPKQVFIDKGFRGTGQYSVVSNGTTTRIMEVFEKSVGFNKR